MDRLQEKGVKLAIVEMGVRTAIPTVRTTSEQIAQKFDVSLMCINPRENSRAEIALPMEAPEALLRLISHPPIFENYNCF